MKMYEMIKDKVKKVKSKIRYFFHPKTIRRMIGKLHPKTIWNGMRSLHYYHWILIAVVAVSLTLTLTHYRIAIVRALSTVIDLFDSLKIYFEVIASPTADLPDGVVARIAQLPQIDLQKILPFDIAELQRRLKDMWPCLLKKEYLIAYLSLVVDYSYYVILLQNINVCSSQFWQIDNVTASCRPLALMRFIVVPTVLKSDLIKTNFPSASPASTRSILGPINKN